MRRLKAYTGVLFLLLFGFLATTVRAEVFTLENGSTYEGTMATLDEDGFVVALDIGDFSKRTEVIYLSQETLRKLAQNPKFSQYVIPFIDLPEEDMKPPEIIVRQPERLTISDKPSSFLSSFTTPIGILFIIAFYLGNLLAAYEVAAYRGRPAALVCGLSVILPVVTPIIFISLPAAEGSYADSSSEEDEYEEAPIEAAPSAPPPPPSAGAPGIPALGQGKLGLKKSAAPVSVSTGAAATAVYTRNDTDFNRHFFETTFSEFFRVVPTPAIKDMVMEFRGTKKEYVAKRVTRISSNELSVQLLDGRKEMAISFGEIVQVKLRHKNDK
jgi:hypothetical protein